MKKERYKAIDDVCTRRGLVKFGAGTNRVVYRHPEFSNILFKIAADDVGLGDNPAEFRNQQFLKPFVAKTFEISPCGTVAVVERLKPILNREEFISIAEDVFELLNTWILGKWVMADVGSKYFMNFGVRSGFGVCLIDYPYLYELDGAKLFCKAPDQNSPTGYCDGEIDYDDGFNFLVCKKCGVKYKAKELAKKIEEKIVTVKERREFNMNIKISGGSKAIKRVESSTTVLEDASVAVTGNMPVKVTPSRPATPKVQFNTGKAAEGESSIKVSTNRKATQETNPESIEKTVNGASMNHKAPDIVPREKLSTESKKVVEPESGVTVPTNNKIITAPVPAADSPVVNAVSFGEKVSSTVDTKSTPVFDMEKAIEVIIKSINKINVSEVKEDAIDRMFDKLTANVDSLSLGKLLIKLLAKAVDKDNDILVSKEMENEFFDKYYELNCRLVKNENRPDEIESTLSPIGNSGKSVMYVLTDVQDDGSSGAKTISEGFAGIAWYSARKINIAEIIPNAEENYDAIAIYDSKGNYLVDDDKMLIAVDMIDNYDLESYEMVSRSWLEGVKAQEQLGTENPFLKEDEIVVSEEPVDAEEQKEAPVGSLPAQQNEESVNEAIEKFVENEAEAKE